MAEAPKLTTDRLILRLHKPSDLLDMQALWSAPEVVKYIGARPLDRESIWKRILMYRGLWATLGFGYWVITDRTTGEFLGEAGFADFQRQIKPSIEGLPEAGWALLPKAFGKGIATEAIQCMLHWLKQNIDTKQSVCLISPDNLASIRVAERCGFEYLTQTLYMDSPSLLYSQIIR